MNNQAAESSVILALERQWCRKLQERDVDWIVSLFARHGRQFPPNAEPVVGPEALRSAWNAMAHTEGLTVSWEPEEAHVAASGDMAYDFGTGTIATADGHVHGAKYVVVWVRQDGEWKVAVDAFNANTSPGN